MISDIHSINIDRCYYLIFKEAVNDAVNDWTNKATDDACMLLKVSNILCIKEYLSIKQCFPDSLSSYKEIDSVPPMLTAFLHMLCDGSHIDQPASAISQPVSSIGQQIIFNSVNISQSTPRHNREREAPAPLYLAIKLHLHTSSASLVETMYK